MAGRVRACFRLIEPPEDAEDAARRGADRGLAAGVRPAGGRPAEPGRRRRPGSGGRAGRCGHWPGTSTLHRRRSWPSSAGPAGSTPTLDDALRTAEAGRARSRRRRGPPVPARGRTHAGRGRVRRAATGLVEPAAGPPRRPAERELAHRARARWPPAAQLGLNSIVEYEWQLALGDEVLTEAELHDAGRAAHAAGPAARPVGRARRQAPRGRAEAAHQRRPDDRRRPAARRTVPAGRSGRAAGRLGRRRRRAR